MTKVQPARREVSRSSAHSSQSRKSHKSQPPGPANFAAIADDLEGQLKSFAPHLCQIVLMRRKFNRSQFHRKAPKLTVAQKCGQILLLHGVRRILNQQKALDFAEKFMGMQSVGNENGETLVRRFWFRRACCGLDPLMRQDISDMAPSQNQFLISGPKVGEVVQFHAETTSLDVDVSKPVGKCLSGVQLSPPS